MMRSIHSPIGVCCCLLLALAGAACSGSEVKPWPQRLAKMGYQVGPAVDTVHHYTVEGALSLDKRHLIVSDDASTGYLITLAGDCDSLHAAESIGFSSTSTDLTLSDDLLIHQVDANYKCPLQAFNLLNRGK